LLKAVPVNKVRKFEEDFLMKMSADHQDVLDSLSAGKYTPELTDVLEKVGAEVSKNYKA
jgi:F-type H+-transporting ATPase subunit alpha